MHDDKCDQGKNKSQGNYETIVESKRRRKEDWKGGRKQGRQIGRLIVHDIQKSANKHT